MNLPVHLNNRAASDKRVNLFQQLAPRRDKGKKAMKMDSPQSDTLYNGITDPRSTTGRGQDHLLSFDEGPPDRTDGQDRGLSQSDAAEPGRLRRGLRSTGSVLKRHLAFVGPGIVASVAYTDPGNWVTDLAAGSQFGYALLFIVLLSGCFGIFLQILAVRMGVVTGFDLARNTRMLLLGEPVDERLADGRRGSQASTTLSSPSSRPLRFRRARHLVLWLLYGVSEGAIVATELAELLGSAIALNLLFPKLPLYAGVLITSADVLLILLVYRPNGNFRIFEILIGTLVLIVMACYVALLVRTKPHWPSVFHGYIPSSTLVEAEALYTGVGIVGAVIMPHALYLGSHFSTQNRTTSKPNSILSSRDHRDNDAQSENGSESGSKNWIEMLRTLRTQVRQKLPDMSPGGRSPNSTPGAHFDVNDDVSPHLPQHLQTTPRISSFSPLHNRMSIAEMRQHLPHAAWDIGLSLFFLAITVNSAILIVAAAAFHYGSGPHDAEVGDLFDAFNLLRDTLGHAYAILFAIALLAAGQAASITCTLAGQIVSEGFINWRTNPFVRRLITRLVTIIPSLAIAVAVGRSGLDKALVASQVALSFALPFVIVPLAIVTSMGARMLITEDVDEEINEDTRDQNEDESADDLQQREREEPDHKRAPTLPRDEILPASPDRACNATHSKPNVRRLSTASKSQAVLATADSSGPSGIAINGLPTFRAKTRSHNFTNGRIVQGLAGVIFLVIVIADVYTLITTFEGKQ